MFNFIQSLTINITFIDVNECANNPCQYGGTCHNKFNSYTCSCAPGFVGENCIGGEYTVF